MFKIKNMLYIILGLVLFSGIVAASAFYAGRVYEASLLSNDSEHADENLPKKPVIYLYPSKETDVSVKVLYKGDLTHTYPEYGNGWKVRAYPDGKILNAVDGKEYSYLFWEGVSKKPVVYDWSKGFVVEGKDVREFLQKVLSEKGLTPKEYNEFIVYWYPKLKDNTYNLIHFASQEEYDDNAPLVIEPQPQSVLRIFMAYKSLPEPVLVTPQEIVPFERKGFTVVEWGGDDASY